LKLLLNLIPSLCVTAYLKRCPVVMRPDTRSGPGRMPREVGKKTGLTKGAQRHWQAIE
jgi:hypothetical protein